MKIVTVLFCGVISFYFLCTFYFKSKIVFQFQRKAKSGFIQSQGLYIDQYVRQIQPFLDEHRYP